MPYECLAVGNDNKVWMSAQKNHVSVKQNLSQLSIMKTGKSFFGGVGEEDRPGAIEIWKLPLEKVHEV
jgi:hypothetical protein